MIIYLTREAYSIRKKFMYVINLPKKNLVLWAIFLSSLGTVLIALSTVVFPNLIMNTFGTMPNYFDINPFELGITAYSLLLTNFIFLGVVILYFKGKMPQKISNSFNFISSFEISKKVTILIMILLIGGFITFTVNQLFTNESFLDYYNVDKPTLEHWTIGDITKQFNLHVKFFLIIISMKLFGSYRIIPYLASISLLVLTYFFTKLITKSRFAGIISMVLVLQSSIFFIYNSSVAYDNFWILFYLLSLYVICKMWQLSAVSLVAAIFTKPLIVAFLPFTLFFIHRSNISKRRKKLTFISYVFVVAASIFAALDWKVATSVNAINMYGFWSAFNAFTYQLRFDPVLVLFLLPVTIMLFLAARKGVIHADSLLFLTMGTILAQPLSAAFTVASSEPYRFMPLVVFFAISVGILLSKNVIVKE